MAIIPTLTLTPTLCIPYTACTIIVLVEDRVKAQTATNDQYFVADASADGLSPATHCFMSGPFGNDEVDAIVNTIWIKWVRSSDWQGALTDLGLVQIIPVIDPSVVLSVPPAK